MLDVATLSGFSSPCQILSSPHSTQRPAVYRCPSRLLFHPSPPSLQEGGLLLSQKSQSWRQTLLRFLPTRLTNTPTPPFLQPLDQRYSTAHPDGPWVPGTFFPVPLLPLLLPSQPLNTVKQPKTLLPASTHSFKELSSRFSGSMPSLHIPSWTHCHVFTPSSSMKMSQGHWPAQCLTQWILICIH